MGKRKKTWAEIKPTKTEEEWRRVNRIYDFRRRQKEQLMRKGRGLLLRISNNRQLIPSPGPAEALTFEVEKALALPFRWGQESYDQAVARLDEISVHISKIERGEIPPTPELENQLLKLIADSKDSDVVKISCVMGTAENLANRITSEQADNLEENATNYMVSLMRERDGHYPGWLPKRLFDNILHLLSDKDLQILGEWIRDEQYDRPREL